jgi:hypothetical protein
MLTKPRVSLPCRHYQRCLILRHTDVTAVVSGRICGRVTCFIQQSAMLPGKRDATGYSESLSYDFALNGRKRSLMQLAAGTPGTLRTTGSSLYVTESARVSPSACSLGLFFGPEEGSDKFLRNVYRLLDVTVGREILKISQSNRIS